MKKLNLNVLAAVLVVAALAAMIGCGGSNEKSESTATEKAAKSAEQPDVAQQKAQETQPAVDWSAYSNPKPGVDPVCQMTLEPAYVTETTIAGKKYALCSSRCVNMLLENPDQYLSAAASAEESHEGHTH